MRPRNGPLRTLIEQSVAAIRKQVGGARVLAAVSGGVDSSVATTLLHRAVGDQLSALFVDNGLLRQGERESVEAAMKSRMGESFHVVDASAEFLGALRGVTIRKPSGARSAQPSSVPSRLLPANRKVFPS
jgi:GMP synthase (glutamine-hydrolysing)